MTSEFNARSVREKYDDFNGKIKEQISLLLADRRYPMFSTQVFEERLQGRGIGRHVHTGDLVAYNGPKSNYQEVRIVLTANKSGLTEVGRLALNLINPQSDYVNGALNLNKARDAKGKVVNGAYDALSGNGVIIAKRKDLGILNQDLTHEQRMNHKGWRILARHPDEVPKEFAEDFEAFKTYSESVVAQRYNQAMGFYLADGETVPTLRAFYVGRLDVGRGSGADGFTVLVYDNGRLVGVAPEAPNALDTNIPNSQSVKPYSLEDLAAFDHSVKALENVINPDLLKLFQQLRSKL